MKPAKIAAWLLLLATLSSSTRSIPAARAQCTAFCLRDDLTVIVGKNLDWDCGDGLLVAHPRDAGHGRRFGSVTFNQFGADLPLGGLNEVGLVVEELSYAPTRCPDTEGRPAVNELTWIQHLLDRCGSVDEALGTADTLAVERRRFGLHYLLADRAGDVAVVEFLDGRMVVYRSADLPVPVLANDTYDNSLNYLRRHAGFGGERRETDGPESPERFVRAARGVAAFADGVGAEDPVAHAFAVLQSVRQQDTRWSVVYDARALSVTFRVSVRPGPRTVRLDDLELHRTPRRRVLDLVGTVLPGPSSEWVDWSPEIERRLRARVGAFP